MDTNRRGNFAMYILLFIACTVFASAQASATWVATQGYPSLAPMLKTVLPAPAQTQSA